jgi:protein ImuB
LPIAWLVSVIDLDRYLRLPGQGARAHAGSSDTMAAWRRRRPGGRQYRMAPAPDAIGPNAATAPADRRHANRPAALPSRSSRHTDAEWQRLLTIYRERLATFERWGIRTCADLAALPRADVHARMGASGVRLHQAACGEDVSPLVPIDEAPVFVDRVDLEWPIEGLEPLSFVLARQCERLSGQLEQADRGAVTLHTTLWLTTRARHVRTLALPAPMRDAKVLRTLILLDLESHPPPSGIDVVELRVDVTPGRIVQGSLLARAVPSPEQISTLLARLSALCGEDRVGTPVALDTHDGRPCAVASFRAPSETMRGTGTTPAGEDHATRWQTAYLRRLRLPMVARVTTEHGIPTRVVVASRVGSGQVRACAGPWRTSGGWWDLQRTTTWNRDEWDVELTDGSVCRLVRHRTTGQWEVDGFFD